MLHEPRTLDEIRRMSDTTSDQYVNMVLEYDNLYKMYRRIDDLEKHLRREINLAYGRQVALEEYCDAKDGDPKEDINDLIALLEKSLENAKELRDHCHQWEPVYHDGRDLDGMCTICGIMAT